jgi:hypothetical protein
MGNIATIIFFAVLAVLFLLSFIVLEDWQPMGRAASIVFAILFAGLAYRAIWGMRHGE